MPSRRFRRPAGVSPSGRATAGSCSTLTRWQPDECAGRAGPDLERAGVGDGNRPGRFSRRQHQPADVRRLAGWPAFPRHQRRTQSRHGAQSTASHRRAELDGGVETSRTAVTSQSPCSGISRRGIQRRFLDRVTRSNPWWPMAISGVNAATRRALVLILHPSIEPFSLAADGSSKSQRWTRRPLRSAWLARMSSRGRR